MRKAITGDPARALILFIACLALALAACAPSPTAQSAATNATAAQPTGTQPPAGEATEPAAQTVAGQMVWVLAGDGNQARYRVTEQLASRDFPSDAIGETTSLTGQLVISPDGAVMTDASKFVVDLTTLKSDRSMREPPMTANTATPITMVSTPLPTAARRS